MPRPEETRTTHRGQDKAATASGVPLETLEEKLGYTFRKRELLTRALTHRSALGDRGPLPSDHATDIRETSDNEQLEFLGDSILGFVASEALVMRNPGGHEGQLSQWKAHLVSAAHLHECAIGLELGQHLLLGKGEERNGGRERRTLLANGLEAVIAAIYLDGGMERARMFIEEHVLSVLESPDDVESIGLLNHKSVLQEKTQAMGLPVPRYTTVETSGPEHAKIFTVEVRVGNRFAMRADGSSKKAASQRAAQLLLDHLHVSAESSAREAAEVEKS
jgi:ribonuclease-3